MKTKKFINDPHDVTRDTVEGFLEAFSHKIEKLPTANVLIRKNLPMGQVGVIIGNGSGHEPACIGFVGENMLTANAYGEVFTAPGPDTIYEAIRASEKGKGVLVLISNHAGDVMNTRMAMDMAEEDGILCKEVLLYDDVASGPREAPWERRGTAGTLFSYKIAGSYASEGHDLSKVVEMAERVRDNTRTLTVATRPGTSPVTGTRTFEVGEEEIILGIGVHGESANTSMAMAPSREIAELMCRTLLEDMVILQGEEVAVLVNGCGQTTLMEQLIFFGDVKAILNQHGINVFRPAIGNFITTQEMGGIALSFLKLDEEMKRAWAKETDAPYFKV